MTLRIARAGITTLQDRGRLGWAHLGVPTSGAADRASHALANRLAGNPEEAAAFETSGGLVLAVLHDTNVVIAGADCEAFIDDTPLRRCVATGVRAGQRIRIERIRDGVHTYLSVSGGLAGPRVLGSQSHDMLSGIVPLVLTEGVELATGDSHASVTSLDVVVSPRRSDRLLLQPGPHVELLPTTARAELTRHTWTVSPTSNRVGVRLTSSLSSIDVPAELASIPLVRGAVQLTPACELVVMLSDHPTTGGYPVIGVVDPDDVDGLAQCPSGFSVRLRW
ncbi:MAG: biotin-dependent carboxyltransferase family protein [Actinomycetota bacterium]